MESKQKRKSKTAVKSKRPASSPKQKRKAKKKDAEDKHPQKTRWEPLGSAQPETQVASSKEEEQKSHQQRQIKDFLEDKEKILEYLFLTVTETTLQELIPDYLKKRSVEELKSLCAVELQKISPEEILQIISVGKLRVPDKKVESAVEETEEISTKQSNIVEIETPATEPSTERLSSAVPSPEKTESFSNDVLELNPSSNEMKCLTDEENQAPISIEEVAKDLYASEKDADIIELEMRARVIVSLLKAKGQSASESGSGEEE